jgi:hypothetical protein
VSEEQIDQRNVPKTEELAGGFRMMCDSDEEEARVMNKLRTFYNLEPSEDKWVMGTVSVLGKGELGPREMRGLCKIGFNYFAHVCEELLYCRDILLNPCFDEIREFIRYGTQPSFQPVTLARGESPPDTPGELPQRGRHIVSAQIDLIGRQHVITSLVNLFDSLVWRVTLTPKYKSVICPIGYGHIWDLANKTCTQFSAVNSL